MKLTFTRISSLALLTALAVSCSRDEQVAPTTPVAAEATQDATATRDSHLALGNPSGATTNAAYPTNYLLSKAQYAASYHRDRGTPNWVSWHTSTSWLGGTARQNDFRSDPALPTGWYRVGSTAYSGSGFDRGHNCPSADRTGSVTDNSGTFFMTNMIPQAPYMNQQTWENMESYVRTLVRAGSEVYCIMGQYGTGGTGTNGYATTINSGRTTVPARVWRVMVIMPNGADDVNRVGTARVIAVNVPNTNSVSTSWGTYRTSVDAIEAATGLDLLSAVPGTVQGTVEARVDAGPTN